MPFSTLAFPSKKERTQIHSRGLQALSEGKISKEALQLGETYRKQLQTGYTPPISIRPINERVGHGVFAEEDFPKSCYIGEYTGIVRENVRVYFAPLNNYCYEYPLPDPKGRNYVIDATQGNFARFINHSYKPNLLPHYAFLDGLYHVLFLTLHPIHKGEQLCYEYGSSYWSIRPPPEEF